MPKETEQEEKEIETSERKEKEIQKVVVKELPMQQTNVGTITETGEQVQLITIEDAITEMYEDIKAIKKAVA